MRDTTMSWRRASIFLFLFVLSIVGPLIHPLTDQPASRYALSAALWESQTVQLDEFDHAVGRDSAVKDGHTYSDKAPLQPFLGVPLYGVARLVGAESASVVRPAFNLGLWWQSFWFASVPLAVIAVILFGTLRPLPAERRTYATLSLVFGTILFPFGAMLFGHALAALFLIGAIVLLLSDEIDRTRLLGAGALAGAAVATEYPTVVAVLVLTVYVVYKAPRSVHWYVLGGAPFAGFLAIYHTVAFGSPLAHPYTYTAFLGVRESQSGLLDAFSSFSFENLIKLFVSGRGFLIASPIVLIGLIGLVQMIRERSGTEREKGVVALAVFVAMMAVPLYWANPWGGHSPGARYLVPALPVLAFGVAAAWSWRPLLTRIAVGLGVVTMALATFTNPLVDDEGPGGIGTWLGLAADGKFVDTTFTMAFGAWGWLIHGVIVGSIGWLLLSALGPRSLERGSGPVRSRPAHNGP